MRRYKDLYKGSRCIIACNGPSLNDIDFSLLRNEIIFGLNRGYLKKDMPIQYLVAVNNLVVKQFKQEMIAELSAGNIRDIFGWNVGKPLYFTDDTPTFQGDATRPLWQGHTVTYVALQVAFYMGFKDVALIGCDHSYSFKGSNNQLLVADGEDVNHFDKTYFANGAKWHAPNLNRTEIAYKLARKHYEADNRRIINCSTTTELEVFERQTLEEWLNGERSKLGED